MRKQDNTKVNITAVIALMLTSFSVGVVYMWSALKGAAENYFGWSSASANMVSSIMLFAFTGGCFIGGMICDSIGPKKTSFIGTLMFGGGVLLSSVLPVSSSIVLFFITYSVVAGAGSGFVFTSTMSSLPKWFPERVGLGTGLAAATFGISTVVFSPVVGALLKTFSLPATLKIMAAVCFTLATVGCLFIRLPGEAFSKAHVFRPACKNEVSVNLNLWEAMKIRSFWLLFMSLFLVTGAWNMLTPLIKGLGLERGLSEGAAILCLSMTGVANALGRLCMSCLSDKIGRYNALYFLCLLTGVSSIALATVTGNLYFAAVMGMAFSYGGPASVFPAMCTDLFGPRYSGRNYGFIMLALGISSVTFNALSNALYAATGAYTATFTVGMISALIPVILIRTIRIRVIKIKNVRYAPGAKTA